MPGLKGPLRASAALRFSLSARWRSLRPLTPGVGSGILSGRRRCRSIASQGGESESLKPSVAHLEGDLLDGRAEFWLCPGDEPAYDAVGPVPSEDLADPVVDAYREAIGGDRHVAEDEAVSEGRRAHRELGKSLVEPAFRRLDGGAGVMGDEVHYLVVNTE